MNLSNQRRDFRLLIHESEGQAFEDLFVKIMQYANVNFVPVKPHGSDGDRKNDGYDPSKGIYFQVYAPEDASKRPYNTIKKLLKDFEGLQAYWNSYTPIQEFYFVINDKYKGVYPKVHTRLKKIQKRCGLLRCEPFLAQHLEATLFNLSSDIIESLLNSSGTEKTQVAQKASGVGQVVSGSGPFTSHNHIDTLIYELVQKTQNRVAIHSDLLVYGPVIAKYGMEKGKTIVERSLKAGQRKKL